jgi:hypothetical protein
MGESKAKTCEVGVSVTSLSGRELFLDLPEDSLVKDLKSVVKASWGIPIREQKMVSMGQILHNMDTLGTCSENAELNVFLVRGASFHFDANLAHPRIKLGADHATIVHGGQPEYQAAFLSDVLDIEGTYSVHFKLEGTGPAPFREMYVGVAPDQDRNWSNLKGAYLNHQGIYVDAFDESGWKRGSAIMIKSFIFERRLCDLKDSQEEFTWPVLDFATDGEIEFPNASNCEWISAAEERGKTSQSACTCEFVLEVDMPKRRLRFLSREGREVQTLTLPELQLQDVRLCATLGYPGQKVSILDDA